MHHKNVEYINIVKVPLIVLEYKMNIVQALFRKVLFCSVKKQTRHRMLAFVAGVRFNVPPSHLKRTQIDET